MVTEVPLMGNSETSLKIAQFDEKPVETERDPEKHPGDRDHRLRAEVQVQVIAGDRSAYDWREKLGPDRGEAP